MRILRRRYFWEAAMAVMLLWIGYAFGGARYGPVVMQGTRTTGTVVGYETQHRSRRQHRLGMMRTVYMPVVEFEAAGRTIRFRNLWGLKIAPTKGETVHILYDPDDPSLAVIDHPRKWIPWALFLAFGAFMAVVALRSWVVSRRS